MLVPAPQDVSCAPRLNRAFFARDTLVVARELLGMTLLYESKSKCTKVVLIAETEAYIGVEDQAAHSRFGKTKRNAVMWGPAGYTYVFLIYGMYHCLNIVTEAEGSPAAVLIRGGILLSQEKTEQLNGPGKLTRALGITRHESGIDVTTSPALSVHDLGIRPANIVTTTRIGIEYAGDWAAKPWRFVAQFDQPALTYAPGGRVDIPRTSGTPSRSHE
jgi:DNA-3-methyladenine glycosylase